MQKGKYCTLQCLFHPRIMRQASQEYCIPQVVLHIQSIKSNYAVNEGITSTDALTIKYRRNTSCEVEHLCKYFKIFTNIPRAITYSLLICKLLTSKVFCHHYHHKHTSTIEHYHGLCEAKAFRIVIVNQRIFQFAYMIRSSRFRDDI